MTSFKYNYENPSVRWKFFANMPLPSSKNSHFQNEARCSTFLVEMSFICTRMKNDFHIKGRAPTLVLKQRPERTRKRPSGLYCFFKPQREWQFFKNKKAKTKWIVVVVVKFRFKVSKVCHTAINHSLRASSLGRSTTTTRKCPISRFMEDVNKRRPQFLSLSKLECCPQEINSK